MRAVVVGAGIAGIAAALELADLRAAGAPLSEIMLVEATDHPGGKLRTGRIDGRRVETGAEAFLARAADDPTGAPSPAVRLAERLGVPLVHPATTSAGILADGRLATLPPGTLMGIPADASALVKPYGPADGDDTDRGRPVLGPDADVTVGALVRQRIGGSVVDRLVDPLLGGVYAGRADDLSLAVTMPGLAAACRHEPTLQAAVRSALAQRSTRPGPVFATPADGVSALVDAALAAMPGVTVRFGQPVRELHPDRNGWRLLLGSARAPEPLTADAVILAVPAAPMARLLRGVDAYAAALVGALDYASIALATFVLPAGALDGTALHGKSGALIPAIEDPWIKAITVFSTKWAGQSDGSVLLRASFGRYGETEPLARIDEDLLDTAYSDIAAVADARLPRPLARSLTRWGGALPQYAPGHLTRIAAARAALPPTLALAGAACDGVGIPICITSGQAAAARIAQAG